MYVKTKTNPCECCWLCYPMIPAMRAPEPSFRRFVSKLSSLFSRVLKSPRAFFYWSRKNRGLALYNKIDRDISIFRHILFFSEGETRVKIEPVNFGAVVFQLHPVHMAHQTLCRAMYIECIIPGKTEGIVGAIIHKYAFYFFTL